MKNVNVGFFHKKRRHFLFHLLCPKRVSQQFALNSTLVLTTVDIKHVAHNKSKIH